MLRYVRADLATRSIRIALDRISRACSDCQTFCPAPSLFRASLPPDQLVLNDELAVDLIWIEGVALFHVIDTTLISRTLVSCAAKLQITVGTPFWNAFPPSSLVSHNNYDLIRKRALQGVLSLI